MDQKLSAVVETLGELDDAVREAVLRRALYHERRLKRADKAAESAGRAGVPFITLLFLAPAVGPYAFGRSAGVEFTPAEWIKAYAVYLGTGAATIAIPVGLYLLSRRWRTQKGGWDEAGRFLYLCFYTIVASVVVAPVLMLAVPYRRSVPLFGMVTGAGLLLFLCVGFLAAVVVELPRMIIKVRRLRRRYADTTSSTLWVMPFWRCSICHRPGPGHTGLRRERSRTPRFAWSAICRIFLAPPTRRNGPIVTRRPKWRRFSAG